MDTESAKQQIKELVESFRKVPQEELDKKSEEQIKFLYIEPMLEALGWRREDIYKEQRVLKGRADYILKIGNQEVLVVEAKRTGVGLTEEEGRQAVSYAYHRKIKFAVLTNFKQIRVYHALSNIKDINRNLLKDGKGYLWINCEDFDEKFDRLWLLSRESFEKGEINKLLSAKDERLSKPIDESILDDLLQYRDWLSKDLKKLRMYLSPLQIDEIVQILIDRLIFMHSVEDRELEEKDFLLNIVKDFQDGRTEKRLWELLKIQFRIFDKTYNSKLFEEGLLEKEGFFDESTLIKVIRGLYFGTKDNHERYMFDEIPGDLLGTIYEQYLGTILKGTEKRVKLEEGTGKRKKMGIYYTPSYIVDYIVKNTVGEYTKDRTIDEILEVKILDPACGSGSFLIRAFQEVCEAVESRLKKGERSKNWTAFKDYKGRLNLGQKIQILANCIYGVDLDEKAVELAQLNLLLRLLDDETRETKKRLLPSMKDNIKCGNSLIDDLSVSDKAFNWQAQFPDIFRHGGFDIVIGNPPYIDSEEMVRTQPEFRQIYSKIYSTARGNWDIFCIFIEKGLVLLKNNGLFGMIIPNKLLSADYAVEIRRYIQKYKIVAIRDYSKIPVFQASVYPIIAIVKKEHGGKNKFSAELMEPYGDGARLSYSKKMEQEDLEKTPQNTWAHIFEESGSTIIDKILSDSSSLGDIAEVFGAATVSEAYELKKLIKEASNQKEYFMFINTGTIDRYSSLWGLFTTTYIKDSYNKPVILKEQLKRFSNKRYDESLKTKIIIAGMSKILECYLDEGEYLAGKSTTIITTSTKLNIKYILAVLNSKVMTFAYKKLFKSLSLQGGYMRIGPPQIKNLPIKIVPENQQQSLISLVNQMLPLQKKYHGGKIAGREKELLEQQIKQVDWQIDDLVYKLYGITEDEKKLIEESLR